MFNTRLDTIRADLVYINLRMGPLGFSDRNNIKFTLQAFFFLSVEDGYIDSFKRVSR